MEIMRRIIGQSSASIFILTVAFGFIFRSLAGMIWGWNTLSLNTPFTGKIVVSDRPSPNHYVATAYRLVEESTPENWAAAPICVPSFASIISVSNATPEASESPPMAMRARAISSRFCGVSTWPGKRDSSSLSDRIASSGLPMPR